MRAERATRRAPQRGPCGRHRDHEPAAAGEKSAQHVEPACAGVFRDEALRAGGDAEIDQPAEEQHPGPHIDVDAELERAHPAREQHLAAVEQRGARDADQERGARGALRARAVRAVGHPGAHSLGRARNMRAAIGMLGAGESHASLGSWDPSHSNRALTFCWLSAVREAKKSSYKFNGLNRVRAIAVRFRAGRTRAEVAPQPFSPRKPKGAERRKTPGLARPRERLAQPPARLRGVPPSSCEEEGAPLGAPPRHFSAPGRASGPARAGPFSASSSRRGRSDPQGGSRSRPGTMLVRHIRRRRLHPMFKTPHENAPRWMEYGGI